jgi:hypothetical protein
VLDLCRVRSTLVLLMLQMLSFWTCPRGDLIEVSSSSYGLSLFSLKVGSDPDEGMGAASSESSSVSVGEL